VAEHAEVARVEVEGGEALGEAPMPVRAQLHQQEAGTAAQSPRRGCPRAGGISRHLPMVSRELNCLYYEQFGYKHTWRKERNAMVSVRYISDDVDAAVDFYVERLGFNVEMRGGPGFAMLSRGDLRLLLNRSGAGGAGQPMPDGRRPEPGGWNRIQIEVSDLERQVEALREAGASFRNEIVTGRGGSQILLEDPSGNPIELFQPAGA
jgi:catechol 2,3-dioxygenase-like lactoylglutathione lyase family enzyme